MRISRIRVWIYTLGALLVTFGGVSGAEHLGRIDRTMGRQPAYATKQPKYCLLVFGPAAETRLWLVLDLAYDPLREKPGKTESLYADRNGNGDLTDAGERIPVTVVAEKYFDKFSGKEHEQHLPRFLVGDVKSRDGKRVYKNLVIDIGWFVFGRKDREATVAVDVPEFGRQSAGGEQLWFADTPEKAPVIWFDGGLTMRLAPSGLLHCPVDYSGKEPPPPWYEEFPLVRGKTMPLRIQIGSTGIGLGTFTSISAGQPPKDVHPAAKVVFPHADPKKSPIEVAVELNQRCCGTLFQGSLAVPAEAALGKARITLSFPSWRDRKIEPAVIEIAVSDKDTRPRVFQEP